MHSLFTGEWVLFNPGAYDPDAGVRGLPPGLEEADRSLYTEFASSWGIDARPSSLSVFRFLRDAGRTVVPGAILVDLGAGQSRYAFFFRHASYVAIDFAAGDAKWDYSKLDITGDICEAGFLRDNSVDYCLNTVTLEHLPEPGKFLESAARVLRHGGRLFLYAPMVAPEHQVPYDFFRYTSFGLRHLAEKAGLRVVSIQPSAGALTTIAEQLEAMLSGIRSERTMIKSAALAFRILARFAVVPACSWLDQYCETRQPDCWLMIADKPGDKTTRNHGSREDVIRSIVRCPQCHAELQLQSDTGQAWICKGCGRHFLVKGKTIQFA